MYYKKKFLWIVLFILFCFGLDAYGGWKIKSRFDGKWKYDDNVFNWSPTKIRTYKAKDPGDETSSRFNDMKSPADSIFNPAFMFKASGPSLFGTKLVLDLDFEYEAHFQNTRKNNSELSLTLKQSMWKRGNLKLKSNYVPKMFKRNYLTDAFAESDGNVLRGNRVYEPGTYQQWEYGLEYEHRLLKKRQTGFFGLTTHLGMDILKRRYELKFRGRNRDSQFLEFGMDMDFKGGWEIDFRYAYETAESPIMQEVVLLDEPYFNVDFNNDGDILDDDIRMQQMVNRSYKANHLKVAVEGNFIKVINAKVSLAHRLKNFSSNELYDGYNGRDDTRWVIGVELDLKIQSGVHFIGGYKYRIQNTSSINVTEDIADYSNNGIMAAFVYRF